MRSKKCQEELKFLYLKILPFIHKDCIQQNRVIVLGAGSGKFSNLLKIPLSSFCGASIFHGDIFEWPTLIFDEAIHQAV